MFNKIIDISSKVYSLTPDELDKRVEEVLAMMVHCDCIDCLDEEFRLEAMMLSNIANDDQSKSFIVEKIEKLLNEGE